MPTSHIAKTDDVNPFERATSSYGHIRPGYPAAAVDTLIGACEASGLQTGSSVRIADIGAGTGKMTTLLPLNRPGQCAINSPAFFMGMTSPTFRP